MVLCAENTHAKTWVLEIIRLLTHIPMATMTHSTKVHRVTQIDIHIKYYNKMSKHGELCPGGVWDRPLCSYTASFTFY